VRRLAGLVLLVIGATVEPSIVRAQAGPPYLTNDPGTPGNLQWEINLGFMPTFTRGLADYQIPQIDINFGLGDRVQLTYEIPYVIQTAGGQGSQGAWGNGFPGLKWRFLDQGEDGWQASVFPQLETAAGTSAQRSGIGTFGPRVLLPLEVTHKIGALDVDGEIGFFLPRNGVNERIAGFVVGHEFSETLELDAEIYDDRVSGSLQRRNTTLDVGGRYHVNDHFIALFMAGPGLNGHAAGQTEFMGYLGVQILIH
jgi:hypothetical protein